MVVSVGGVAVGAVGAEPGVDSQARPGSARGGRRDVLRGLLAGVGALAFAPLVAASRPPRKGDDPGALGFEETYRGRRVHGVRTSAGRASGGARWYVTVDGRPLHLMRRADGTWLSMVDHYRSYDTPLDATRAAVDELRPGQQLRETHMGGHHGVHP
ncbi:tyrosinase co-factor [Streptomyces sp. S3(2020)]|uniref:tyrosinase family oxidase copper chaperone n=1 Tax=Streptomyces sp. S3(2020) TaxID=2732044 RepID=UPI001489C8B7|nr:tyrosinase family oxidase copper chaperone [Streptomyces sp. S3(2020)]NNN34369.1 tyrosinase co-factor [Streptomyces sp. S3(2020)]